MVKRPKKIEPAAQTAHSATASLKEEQLKDSDLVDFKLLAITNNSVYLLNNNKQLVKMELGQSAHGGKLEQIDKQKSIATFNVIQNGRPKRITLGLD